MPVPHRKPLPAALVASLFAVLPGSATAQPLEAEEPSLGGATHDTQSDEQPLPAATQEPPAEERAGAQPAQGTADEQPLYPPAQEPEPLPPERALRPLSPDRPDATESPHSVDAGHLQIEMDFFSSERDAGNSTLSFGVTNLKLGVASFLDLQLVLRPLVSTPPSVQDGPRGLGYADPITRVKVALFGNDEGPFALGLLPWVRIPVPGSAGEIDAMGAVDRTWEGGLSLPIGADLPWEMSLGAMVEVDYARNAALDGHHPEVVGTLTVGRTVVGPLSFFVEGTVRAVFEDELGLPATVNGGLLYEVNEDLVIDLGAYVGVTDDAPDLVSFVGMTSRI